ncbi:glycoside hydrolase family 61 protein [Colletotrichum asianum]
MCVEIVVPLFSADLAGTMKAGTIITSNWKQWTHAQGPVMVWLYDCGSDFKSCRGDKQTWFKIDQMGLWDSNLNSENWGIALVLKRNLKPRKYLPRYELLALYQANTPQFYAECAQVVIEGPGTAYANFVYFHIPRRTHVFRPARGCCVVRMRIAVVTPPS